MRYREKEEDRDRDRDENIDRDREKGGKKEKKDTHLTRLFRGEPICWML